MLVSFINWITDRVGRKPSVVAPLERMRIRPDGSKTNPLMIQFFTWDSLNERVSWWKHLEEEIPNLVEQGYTQIWLPPPNKAAEPEGRGYDAYDLWDLGEFARKGTIETRWGTREELLSACNIAHEYGIDIIIDAVLNHKLGADRHETFHAVPCRPENRLRTSGPVREIQGWTGFDYPGRGDKYSSFRWNQAHFTGVDFDNQTKTQEIYRIVGAGHEGWSRNVDAELGNYDFLLGIDIDHRHPEVQEDLLKWGNWILETTGAGGFRLDAIKHFDKKFLLHWIQTVKQRSGNPNLFVVSEYWSGNISNIMPYIRHFKGETAFFDVPLHTNLYHASLQREKYDLRQILKGTITQVKPGDAVTFVDNHDTVVGQSLESWVEDHFKVQAYALILLRGTGYPCVFYGDLYPNKECYNEDVAANLRLLVKARNKYAYGESRDYFAQRNSIAFVRDGNQEHSGCVVILSNKESPTFVHELRIDVKKDNAGLAYRNLMASDERKVQVDENGWGNFSCPANSVAVWVKDG
ncbi:alpha amylase [Coprinopsis marcescibilis]|uniref:Alpha amylase n=1 Tax=Coprinopsis marcescibilis TaxID=230819 RepID=A0A5C3LHX1_COPMA|nr:alpha amylase [Coprinopsis marcescibilis]